MYNDLSNEECAQIIVIIIIIIVHKLKLSMSWPVLRKRRTVQNLRVHYTAYDSFILSDIFYTIVLL
jgi:hypothetical protein